VKSGAFWRNLTVALLAAGVVGVIGCSDASTRVVGPSAQDVPAYLQPLARCAQAHGYAVPPVTWIARQARSLSNGAAICCIAGSESAVVQRWGIVGCYGAVPVETEQAFKLKIADRCTGPAGERFTANKWYAHHELTHIVLRAATGDWDDGHADSLWTECPNPFDPRPLFDSGWPSRHPTGDQP